MKKKKVVEPTIFYFNSWHKQQMKKIKGDEDKNETTADVRRRKMKTGGKGKE